MIGHRSIYHDSWRAVCPWSGPSFTEVGAFFGEAIPAEKLAELDANHWELYHIAGGFAENHVLAPRKPKGLEAVGGALGLTEETEEEAAHRAKLIEVIGQWYVEAGEYNVLPVDGRSVTRFAEQRPRSHPAAAVTPTIRTHGQCPSMRARAW